MAHSQKDPLLKWALDPQKEETQTQQMPPQPQNDLKRRIICALGEIEKYLEQNYKPVFETSDHKVVMELEN